MEVEFVEDTLLEEILLEEDKVCDDEVSVVASDDVCAGPSWCFIVIMALPSEVDAANCVLRLKRTKGIFIMPASKAHLHLDIT